VAIFLGGIGAVTLSQAALIQIESKMMRMQSFHSPALSTIQEIQSDLARAVQESFAYVISGQLSEKQNFEYWVRSFPNQAQKFRQFAELDTPEKSMSKATFGKFLVLREELERSAKMMFSDYERTGAVSHEIFESYEIAIDEVDALLSNLVTLQRQHVKEQFENSLKLRTQIVAHSP
jgi:hypothetical protein